MATVSIAVVVVSDTCSVDPTGDKTGPALLSAIDDSAIAGVTTVKYVADNREDIQDILRTLIAEEYSVVLTAGGTGFSRRDVTPEAVRPLLEKEASGLVVAMLTASLSITPMAAIARPVAGTASNTLIVTLPGSPKGARENFQAIQRALPHAIELMRNDGSREIHARPGSCMNQSANMVPQKSRSNSHKHTHSPSISELDKPAFVSGSPESRSKELLADDAAHSKPHSHCCSHSKTHTSTHGGPKFFGPAFRHRTSPYPMISFDDAVSIVVENAPEPIVTEVPLEDALGCVLAKDIVAPVNIPAFRASIVDGYAIYHGDFENESKLTLPLSKISLASSELAALPAHTCVRITTGAPVPHGATAVVPVENTEVAEEADGEELKITIVAENVKSGDNIREIGSDVSHGSLVLSQSTKISSLGGEIGVLASLGIISVPVYRKPVVGVLSTGDEIVNSGGALSGSLIWDSNRPMLLANLRSWLGPECVVDLGIARDNFESLASEVESALQTVDILVTSGGVSMGELDLLKPLIKHLRGEIKFGRVAMKPGKPVTFATLPQNKVILALPGNPVSCIVCLQLFGHPLLAKIMGQSRSPERDDWFTVELKSNITLDSRPEFQRGLATQSPDGKWLWESTGFQRSSRVLSMVRANTLIRLPASSDETKVLPKGTKVKAQFMGLNTLF